MRYKLLLPLYGFDGIVFTTKTGSVVATGYTRVVCGGRGPYIEFEDRHIVFDAFYVPDHEVWRLDSCIAYYDEYRSLTDHVMLYHQKKTVKYADYKIGMYYMSPYDLISDLYPILIRNIL